jgi:hypothetical protein
MRRVRRPRFHRLTRTLGWHKRQVPGNVMGNADFPSVRRDHTTQVRDFLSELSLAISLPNLQPKST